MDVFRHNQAAWNREAQAGERWSTPVSEAALKAARSGHPEIFLTPNRSVPAPWLHSLAGSRVLALASGGGQQA
ncbi:MAG: SAM-dependent methyltransferase, partial [Pseudomonadales bacterium]